MGTNAGARADVVNNGDTGIVIVVIGRHDGGGCSDGCVILWALL